MYEKLFYIVHNLYHNFNTVPVLKEEKKKNIYLLCTAKTSSDA